MAYQLLTIVSGLGVCSFVACASRSQQLLHYSAGLIGMVLLTGLTGSSTALSYEPAHIGIMTAIAAIYCLQHRARPGFGVFFAGVLSAVWIMTLRIQGLPTGWSAAVILVMALVTFFAALHRSGFASELYRQEALLIVLAGSLFVGVVPDAIASWRSAVNLQEIDDGANTVTGGVGILLIVLAFFCGGSLYAWWKNRRTGS